MCAVCCTQQFGPAAIALFGPVIDLLLAWALNVARVMHALARPFYPGLGLYVCSAIVTAAQFQVGPLIMHHLKCPSDYSFDCSSHQFHPVHPSCCWLHPTRVLQFCRALQDPSHMPERARQDRIIMRAAAS